MAPRMIMQALLLLVISLVGCHHVNAESHTIGGRNLRMVWHRNRENWSANLRMKSAGRHWRTISDSVGYYGLLYNTSSAAQSTSLVQRNQLGNYMQFGPEKVSARKDNSITTTKVLENGTFEATWHIDTRHSHDILSVDVTWRPSVDAWYSIESPRLVTLPDEDLGWGVVPGYWSSNEIEEDADLTYTYVQGVPSKPLVSVEGGTTSLVSIVSSKEKDVSFAVIPDPKLARDPYQTSNISTQTQWNVGLSLRRHNGSLSPTAYYPVLGQANSRASKGDTVKGKFLYTALTKPHTWYDLNSFVHHEVYPLSEYSKRARDLSSLTERMNRIHEFVVTPASLWNTWTYNNLTMGAESGKLSDVAAMWMTHRLTNDPVMEAERLPYARNFKLGQQDTSGGEFDGAAVGEYYKNGGFVSELIWASVNSEDYVSPIFTTFYTLSDIGNILLFNKTDTELLKRFKLAAEKLLSWQKPDGSFDIGYLKSNPKTVKYPDLTDNRATWYGFITAYRILDDKRYLKAAEAGARWFIENVLDTGRWLGVCDDAYLYPDFHTAFTAQALLDLYQETRDRRYLDAAVEAARFYTLHIFNHPVPDDGVKTRGDDTLEAWQLSQVGLNYEHAGYKGTAIARGPITISSHAGLFIRIYEATGDTFFLTLARLAARGRDAFVAPASGIPSYYWYDTNTAGSRYPWHGWWHIGWVTDYLMSQAHMLSRGKIDFPHGFITAKVGSHVPYGFDSGSIYGETADLWQPRRLVNMSDAEIDYFTARSTDGQKLFVVMMNEASEVQTATMRLDPRSLLPFKVARWTRAEALVGSVKRGADPNSWTVRIAPEGLAVLAIGTDFTKDSQGPSFRNFTVSGGDDNEANVSWSFWTTVRSWAQWKTPGSRVWINLPSSTNYTFSSVIDLKGVDADVVKIRIASQEGSFKGFSEPVDWSIPRR